MMYFSDMVKASRDRQRERFKAEDRAEWLRGLEEGKAAVNAEWRAWFNELQEAQREGRPFDKPAPDESRSNSA